MKYLSVCSGIEAASVAWHQLGWKPLAFSEIEPFPRAVLAHHYADVPCHGDFTKLRDEAWIVNADVLVGGTPCQAFSVAGLRNSLADDRGNLSLEFVRLADAIDDFRLDAGKPPAIIVWENVPGVLSVKDNAFGCFLAALAGDVTPYVPPRGKWTDAGVVAGPARTVAWRVLDAQYFGLAQRRRRVFVVASARDGFDPAAVLLEFEGLRRDSSPRREAGQVAPTIPARSLGGGGLGTDFDCDGGVIQQGWPADLAPTLNAAFGEKQGLEDQHTLKAEGFDASEDGTGRGTPLVPVAFSYKDSGNDATVELSPTLRALGAYDANGGGQMAVAVSLRGREGGGTAELGDEVQNCLRASSGGGDKPHVLAPVVPLQEVGKRTGVSTDDPRAGIGIGHDGDPMFTLQAGARHGVAYPLDLRNAGRDPDKRDKQNRQGLGLGDDGDPSPTISTAFVPGVAAYGFQPRIARNGRGDTGDIVNALNAQSGGTGKGDAAPCVAVINHGDSDASTQEINAIATLRALRDAVGEEAFAQWRFGILDTLQSPEVLRAFVYGRGVRRAAREAGRWLDDGALSRPQDLPTGALLTLWEDGPDGRSPQGRELAQQLARQLGQALPVLPHQDTPTMAVRRLTPKEAERLQGFPDDYTAIPWPVVSDLGAAQCAKRVVRATVKTVTGKFFVATNYVKAVPSTGCPRGGMKTGEGWHLCKEVCGQKGHAEINALRIAGKHARGATLYVEGHDYVCDGCRAAAEKAGIAAIVIGPADATSCPDGPRYKALGNSMAVPCMRWIGQRIAAEIATAAKTNSEEKAA